MAPEVKITFEKASPVYKPGERVRGKVMILTEAELIINSIDVRYRGKAHNRWYDYRYRSYFHKHEFYMDIQKQLLQTGPNSATSLPPGKHEYDFEFDIPEKSPSSFEGNIGWLRYTVFVKVDRPSATDISVRSAFTVVADMDLNLDDQAKAKPYMEMTKKVGLFGGKPVKVTASCDKGGYVPGENIQVVVDVDNSSDKDIESLKCSVEQKVTYDGKCVCTTDVKKRHTIVKMKENVHGKGQKQKRLTAELCVPSVPPSDLPDCSIISIKYSLKIEVKCGDKISTSFPIRIGTIPLGTTQYGFSDAGRVPTYAESVFGSVNIKEEEDDQSTAEGTEYTPLYPYLHFDAAPPKYSN